MTRTTIVEELRRADEETEASWIVLAGSDRAFCGFPRRRHPPTQRCAEEAAERQLHRTTGHLSNSVHL
ncbi:hypothetical protein ACIHCX_35780 [Streptomyces sp. NPDC052043]|uniref:hypothetical protein n=1 Tax=Streptomyces sp. NPDC052043 TaxID=3365684 RepID=UPI0037D86B7C